ncbi:MAG: glutamate--tRNA ligase [bacterium]
MNTQGTSKIRVRFAPSPTGYLHVGGARTAIFNWLFSKKHQGDFLLRIEDTDRARSGEAMVEAIFAGLKWLGLDWNEEPVFQSQRASLYQSYAEKLLVTKKAFKCFCSQDKLREGRESAAKEKKTFQYDGACRDLSQTELESLQNNRAPYVIRLKVQKGYTEFHDSVFGDIKISHTQIDDFILLRSNGMPTYHFAVVVDDHEMQISHVIRGDDHLSNTPKHILLYQALDWPAPQFVHLPLILGRDQQRLSKRHGATAIGEYEKAGYLPEAMLNFLALLGWSSGDDRELFSREQLISEFDLSGVMKKSAVFDERKLQWMNSQYLMQMDNESLLDRVLPGLVRANILASELAEGDREYLLKIVRLLKPRLKLLSDFTEMARYFFEDPLSYDEKAVRKHWRHPDLVLHLHRLSDALSAVQPFTGDAIETTVRTLAEKFGLSAAKLIHPMRVALTGVAASPGLFEVMEILEQETVLRRLRKAITYIRNKAADGTKKGIGVLD